MEELPRDQQDILRVNVETDKLWFSRPMRCNDNNFFANSKGCHHLTRYFYFEGIGPFGNWTCPICGQPLPFIFWDIKSDDTYQPSEEQVEDVKHMWANIQARVRKEPYPYPDLPLEELVRIHAIQE